MDTSVYLLGEEPSQFTVGWAIVEDCCKGLLWAWRAHISGSVRAESGIFRGRVH